MAITQYLELLFEEGDIVYLATDPEQLPRIVTGYQVRSGIITYCLSCGVLDSWHYGREISATRYILKEHI